MSLKTQTNCVYKSNKTKDNDKELSGVNFTPGIYQTLDIQNPLFLWLGKAASYYRLLIAINFKNYLLNRLLKNCYL